MSESVPTEVCQMQMQKIASVACDINLLARTSNVRVLALQTILLLDEERHRVDVLGRTVWQD